MSLERADNYILTNKKVINDQSKYIATHDWSGIPNRKKRKDEFDLHVMLLKLNLDAVKYVMTEAGDEFRQFGSMVKFCKNIAEDVERFIEVSNLYFERERWDKYEDEKEDQKADEVEFQGIVLRTLNSFREELAKLNINNDVRKDVVLPIHGKSIIPLIMRDMIKIKHPEVEDFISFKQEKA